MPCTFHFWSRVHSYIIYHQPQHQNITYSPCIKSISQQRQISFFQVFLMYNGSLHFLNSTLFYMSNICIDVISNSEEALGPVRLQSRKPWDQKGCCIVVLVVYRSSHSYIHKTHLDNWYNFKIINFQDQLIPKVNMMTPWLAPILNWLTVDCKWLAMPSKLRCLGEKIQARGAQAIKLVLKKTLP